MGIEKKGKDPDFSPLQFTAGVARCADRMLTALMTIFLIVIFLYACFSLWDTWRIYNGAEVDESLLKFKPKSDGDTVGLNELMKINPDISAWLTIENTHIDYPVVRGTDNIKYINTDLYGNFSLSGSIFLDYRNARDFTDTYSLIYGHHMEGNVMFGELTSFTEQEYFKEHETGILYLPETTYRIEIFACLQTDAYDTQMFGPGDLLEGGKEVLLQQIRQSSLQYREIGITGQDRILGLSTCSDVSTNARTIVFGRLKEI